MAQAGCRTPHDSPRDDDDDAEGYDYYDHTPHAPGLCRLNREQTCWEGEAAHTHKKHGSYNAEYQAASGRLFFLLNYSPTHTHTLTHNPFPIITGSKAAVAPVAASDVLFAPEKLCLFRFIPMDPVPSYAFTFHGLVLHSFLSAINAPPLLSFSLNRMYQIIMTLRNVLHSAIAPFCLSPPWWLLPKLDRDVMITHSLQTKQRESEEYG